MRIIGLYMFQSMEESDSITPDSEAERSKKFHWQQQYARTTDLVTFA